MHYRKRLYRFALCGVLCLLAACNSDDDYHYPSVKMEYLTAHTGADKVIESVITDAGEALAVLDDGTGMELPADTTLRIICNYEPMTGVDGKPGVRLHGALKSISPLPMPPAEFKEGIQTDPAEVLSIWQGYGYLNIVLTLKAQDGEHVFHFVENEVTTDDATGEKRVHLLLYHDAGEDIAAYTQRAYLSIPVQQYREPGVPLHVHFSLKTEAGEIKTYKVTFPDKQ